jgi:hypothetical protein
VEHYRRFWEQSLDRLDEYLRELKTKELQTKELESKEKKHGRKQRKP